MNTNFISSKTISTVTKKMVLIFIIFFSGQYYLNAQANLSIQGIIKRSNGAALEDGTYPIKFNIYAKNGPNPNAILWALKPAEEPARHNSAKANLIPPKAESACS